MTGVKPFGSHDRLVEEDGDGHRADSPGTGVTSLALFRALVEVDVPDIALVVARVDHDRSGFDRPPRMNAAPDRGNQDVGLYCMIEGRSVVRE